MKQDKLSVQKAQTPDKRNFDRRMRTQTYYSEPGSFVFIRKDYKREPTENEKAAGS